MITIQSIKSCSASEYYITVLPDTSLPHEFQAATIFQEILDYLSSNGAKIFIERDFGTAEGLSALDTARTTLQDKDDGVAPVRLISKPGLHGEIAGVQIHAVSDELPMETLQDGVGRMLQHKEHSYLALTGLTAPQHGCAAQQAAFLFERANSLLNKYDACFLDVARTWLWLGDILDWYDDLNRVRTACFEKWKVLGSRRLPASTGIGLHPLDGGACGIDLIAMPGHAAEISHLLAGGNQDSAYAYGSAFSRAACIPTPGGKTLYISGTADIDRQGKTQNIDNPAGQIEATIENIRALLCGAGMGDEQLAHAVIYCKNEEVEAEWQRQSRFLKWPCITTIAVVCRDNLLFEIEAVGISPF